MHGEIYCDTQKSETRDRDRQRERERERERERNFIWRIKDAFG